MVSPEKLKKLSIERKFKTFEIGRIWGQGWQRIWGAGMAEW